MSYTNKIHTIKFQENWYFIKYYSMVIHFFLISVLGAILLVQNFVFVDFGACLSSFNDLYKAEE